MENRIWQQILREQNVPPELILRLETATEYPDICDALQRYAENGETPCIREGDYSSRRLMQDFGMTFANALFCIFWLREDYKTASKALSSGFDRIG